MNDETQTGAEALEASEATDDTDLGDGGKRKGWTDPDEP
jgi:hypothetical protein